MRKHPFLTMTLSALTLWTLSACSSANFAVTGVEPPEDAGTDGEEVKLAQKKDSGDADATPLVCEPYSCKPGCGECDSGTRCGSGGVYTCGSMNCSWAYQTDAAAFNCPSGMNKIYECLHYAGKNTQDFMPRCVFQGGTTADGDYTQWCCPQ